jgi:hypothetical protein
MAPASISTQSKFLALPPELRSTIYDIFSGDGEPEYIDVADLYPFQQNSALTATGHQIPQEVVILLKHA